MDKNVNPDQKPYPVGFRFPKVGEIATVAGIVAVGFAVLQADKAPEQLGEKERVEADALYDEPAEAAPEDIDYNELARQREKEMNDARQRFLDNGRFLLWDRSNDKYVVCHAREYTTGADEDSWDLAEWASVFYVFEGTRVDVGVADMYFEIQNNNPGHMYFDDEAGYSRIFGTVRLPINGSCSHVFSSKDEVIDFSKVWEKDHLTA